MFKHTLLASAATLVLAANAVDAHAEAGTEIPPSFRGAGCNLKYEYSRTPKGDASDCINAKAGHKDGNAHDNINFIRIGKDSIAGVEYGCTVRTAKKATETEFTFNADCSEEGQSTPAEVTLILRPGRPGDRGPDYGRPPPHRYLSSSQWLKISPSGP